MLVESSTAVQCSAVYGLWILWLSSGCRMLQDSSSYGGGRSYGGPEAGQGSGGGYSKLYDTQKEWPSS